MKIKRSQSLENSRLMNEYLALNPRMKPQQLVEKIRSDHGVIINLQSARNRAGRYRRELMRNGHKVTASVVPAGNGNIVKAVSIAQALNMLKEAAQVLGGKEQTRQILETIL